MVLKVESCIWFSLLRKGNNVTDLTAAKVLATE